MLVLVLVPELVPERVRVAAGTDATAVPLDTDWLDVYRVAREFDVFAARVLPRRGCASLRDQLQRASSSIVLNIAEGVGRYARPEKAQNGDSPMRLYKASAIVICSVLLALVNACTSTTAEDKRRLAALRGSHGKAYQFYANDIYLEVHTREAVPPLGDIGEDICREFWAGTDGRPRSDSNLVYMNVYSRNREWLGQFHLGRHGKVSFERLREHY